jgi:hypothetical protein
VAFLGLFWDMIGNLGYELEDLGDLWSVAHCGFCGIFFMLVI